jgi:hypothetical protein
MLLDMADLKAVSQAGVEKQLLWMVVLMQVSRYPNLLYEFQPSRPTLSKK